LSITQGGFLWWVWPLGWIVVCSFSNLADRRRVRGMLSTSKLPCNGHAACFAKRKSFFLRALLLHSRQIQKPFDFGIAKAQCLYTGEQSRRDPIHEHALSRHNKEAMPHRIHEARKSTHNARVCNGVWSTRRHSPFNIFENSI
jgi:hypothetical protein